MSGARKERGKGRGGGGVRRAKVVGSGWSLSLGAGWCLGGHGEV